MPASHRICLVVSESKPKAERRVLLCSRRPHEVSRLENPSMGKNRVIALTRNIVISCMKSNRIDTKIHVYLYTHIHRNLHTELDIWMQVEIEIEI